MECLNGAVGFSAGEAIGVLHQQPKKLMRLVYKIVAKEKAPLIAGRTDLGVP
jgi:hypothetical protein